MEKVIERLKRLGKWLVQTRTGKCCLWGVLILLTLVILMYQVANWGGARAWAKTVAALEAEGETLDFAELAPDPGPVAENFGALPMLEGIGVVAGDGDPEDGPGGEKRRQFARFGLSVKGNAQRPRQTGFGHDFARERDLDPWLTYVREGGRFVAPPSGAGPTRDLIAALNEAEELVAELTVGLERPEVMMVPRWENRVGGNPFEMAMPHYQTMMDAVYFFGIRATAAARAGEEEMARESLLVALKLCRLALSDRLLVSVLVAERQLEVVLDALWEGLDRQVFSAGSLGLIQAELRRIDFQAALLAAMRTEMAASTEAIGWVKEQGRREVAGLVAAADSPSRALLMAKLGAGVFPIGWLDRNRATIANWTYEYYIEPLKTGSLLDVVENRGAIEDLLEEASDGFDPGTFIARLLFPAYGKVGEKLVYAEATLDLAISACAVEAYHADRQAYPRSLKSLVPEFLDAVPVDRLSPEGAPVRYLRYIEGGRCRIWSVGWDREDDGGKRVLKEKKPEATRFSDRDYAGDWVWDYHP